VIHALIACIASQSIACVFPLDADASEVGGVGFSPMVLSESYQKGLFALDGDPAAQRKALACPAGAISGEPIRINFASGKKTIEWAPAIPASVGGGASAEAYSVRMYLMESLAAQKVTILLSRLADGTNAVDVSLDGSSVYASTPPTLPARIGVMIDGSGDAASVYFDNVGLSLSSSALTGGEWFAAVAVFEQPACPAGDSGKMVGAQVFTAASDMTGTSYPAGATDTCGNAI